MFRVEVEAGCSGKTHVRDENYCVSRTADDRAGAEAIARDELRRQGVPADQVDFALQHMKHYSAVDIAEGLHAPAFAPESGAHDFTLRILES